MRGVVALSGVVARERGVSGCVSELDAACGAASALALPGPWSPGPAVWRCLLEWGDERIEVG